MIISLAFTFGWRKDLYNTIQYKIFIINDNILSSMILRHPNLCIIFKRMAQKIAHLILYLLPLLLWDLSQCWGGLEAEKDVSARGHGPVDLRQELVHAHVVRSDKSVSDGLELGRQRRCEYRNPLVLLFRYLPLCVFLSISLPSLSFFFLSSHLFQTIWLHLPIHVLPPVYS